MHAGVIFFDLWGTLLIRGQRGPELRPGTRAMLDLPTEHRLGVLCNAGAGRARRDVIRALEAAGVGLRFHRDLVLAASDLPTPLPDRRAFAVAAAMAEVPIDRCVFVSASARLRIAAAAAGMRAVAPEAVSEAPTDAEALSAGPARTAGLLAAEPAGVPTGLGLLAGEVDEDVGPTFALRGRVVRMDGAGQVLRDGRVLVRRGRIVQVAQASEPMPQGFESVPVVETRGTLFPGLIDLHNHFAYNVLPLWVVPRLSSGEPFGDRSQWPKHRDYKPQVSAPLGLLARYSPTAEAIVRYVEAKAILGGTTTGQGIRGKSGTRTTVAVYRGAMRNVEETNDPRLPEARTLVPDLQGSADKIEDFRRALEEQEQSGGAYFYHLAEGVNERARGHYLRLLQNDLLRPALVGIHALGLRGGDLATLAQHGAKVVWSPFSNLLLYGKTLDLRALADSGVAFSIGCDWTPTGSRNLLFELKVARHLAQAQPGAGIGPRELVRAVTADAARLTGWGEHLGVLGKGAFADLLVVAGTEGDPYAHLIDATERQVSLVVIHGVPRYGDRALIEALPGDPAHPAEPIDIGGEPKLLRTFSPSSSINHLSLARARDRLKGALDDLPAFREEVENAAPALLAAGESEGFTLVLDNEPDEDPADGGGAALLAAEEELPASIELDDLTVGGPTFWERLRAQSNLSPELEEAMEHAYR